MKKILLTGFEPFGGYKYNPTQKLATYFNKKTIIGKEKIIGIVLPCTYFGAFQELSAIIDIENPDAIISTGLSSSVQGIRFETVFQNRMKGKYPDANGYNPGGIRINAKRASAMQVSPNCDVELLSSLLIKNNIPTEISKDANTFICNSLAYLTSQKIIKENLLIQNVFIHIPWTDDYQLKIGQLETGKIFLPKENVYRAIELLSEYI